MKPLIATLAALLAPSALGGAPTGPMTLKAKHGDVTFRHEDHASANCFKCHPATERKVRRRDGTEVTVRRRDGAATKLMGPGKIQLTKDSAHKLCIECHKAQANGPTKCAECHEKKDRDKE